MQHFGSGFCSVLAICGLLGACAPVATTPGCTAASPREVRTIDRLIAESETALARGYRMETAPRSGLNLCLGGASDNVGVSFCSDGNRTRPVAIDRQVEQRKLDALKAKRAALDRAQAEAAATCGVAR